MPLRAIINDQEVFATDISNNDWLQLKAQIKSGDANILLPCCGSPGTLRKSKLGLKHFVHSRNAENCSWESESTQHLTAKRDILLAIKACGWNAITEYSEADWRADVLATNGHKRIAFEVQWSRQSLEETKKRQRRFNKSDVRGCWFFRTLTRSLKDFNGNPLALKDLPLFKIHQKENKEIYVNISGEEMPLFDGVVKLLESKVKYCPVTSFPLVQEVTVNLFDYSCWKCGKKQHQYYIEDSFKTNCNQITSIYGYGELYNSFYRNTKIYHDILKFGQENPELKITLGKLKGRYNSKRGNYQLDYGCYFCDTIFGGYYLKHERNEARYEPNDISFKTTAEISIEEMDIPHWCYNEEQKFCGFKYD